jgi:hypothetical protein
MIFEKSSWFSKNCSWYVKFVHDFLKNIHDFFEKRFRVKNNNLKHGSSPICEH